MKIIGCLVASMLATGEASAAADTVTPGAAVELLTPGVASPLPHKGWLPHRETPLVATVGGDLFAGDGSIGVEANISLRLEESLGLGVGLRGSGDGGVFIRLETGGFSVNHWLFLGYFDYVLAGSWWLGGAMIVPWRRDTYIRLSLVSTLDDQLTPEGANLRFGVGLEHDIW